MTTAVYILGGIVNYGAAAYWLRRAIRRRSTWLSARGVIVDFAEEDSSDDAFEPPIVEYTTADAQTHTFTNALAATSYYVGEHVKVLYAPDDPGAAVIDDSKTQWAIPIIGLIAGSVFWVLALVSTWIE